jgi:hypothetical protein
MNAGTTMHADVVASSNTPLRHYMPHQLNGPRPNYQAWDIGAYEYSELETWRSQNFAAAAWDPLIGGNNADPNGNGVPNLLEYAFDGDPVGPGQPMKPFGLILRTNNASYFAINFHRQIPPAAIRYTVQASPDLNTWQDGNSFADNGNVFSNSLTTATTNPTNRETIVRLNQTLGAATQRFLRVRVQE